MGEEFSTLSKTLSEKESTRPPTPNRYEAVRQRIALFIKWHLFSPTLQEYSEQNKQGSSWERLFSFASDDRHAAIMVITKEY